MRIEHFKYLFGKVDIYFTAIGLFDIPTEQELLKTVAQLKKQKEIQEKYA